VRYRKLRKYNSDVHVVEYDPSVNPSQIIRQTDGRKPLSTFQHSWYRRHGFTEVAKINLQTFHTADIKSISFGWTFWDSGHSIGSPSERQTECYFTKDNRFIVADLHGKPIPNDIAWGCSLLYALVIDGERNLYNADKYAHARTKAVRSLIGQKADRTMVLVRADALTAEESADLMLYLGCVTAINADGGGSAQLEVDGKHYGGSRPLGTVLAVLDKVDATPITKPIADTKSDDIRIVLDAGHGPNTKGKRTPDDSMREYYFNSVVADYCRQLLAEYENVETLFTHENGRDVPLEERTDEANAWKADVFVSIHANAITDTDGVPDGWDDRVHGIETFHHPYSSETSKQLGERVQAELLAETGRKSRGVKTANFHVLRETDMPAILAECGFMTNREEAELLKSDAYRRKCANAIVTGLAKQYGLKRKVVESQPKDNVLYRVQVGAFSVKENAERLADGLRKYGYSPIIKEEKR
jgi:N-acetylmuramoyl-L-alanine amidase